MKTGQRVEILIDELVLHGFSPLERHAIGEALSLELGRLVANGGMELLTSLRDIPSIRARNISLKQGEKPASVGKQIAGALHSSLAPREQRGTK